jgi:ATP-dependent Lon protease
MEVIEINSYTSPEKLEIAKRHLLPKQLKIHGLTSKNIRLSSENIMYLIDHYTKESGYLADKVIPSPDEDLEKLLKINCL